MFECTLPFPPTGRNQTKSFRQRNYVERVRELLGPNHPMEGGVILKAIFNPPKAGGFVRYDLDNLLKPTQDALKGIAYIDDNQIRCIHARFGHRTGSGSVYIQIVPIIRNMNKTSIFSKGEETR